VYDCGLRRVGELQPIYRVLRRGSVGSASRRRLAGSVERLHRTRSTPRNARLVSRSLVTQHLDNEMRTWYQAHMLIGEHAGNQMTGSERALYSERHVIHLARLLLSEASLVIWQRVPTGLPHVDQLRQAAAWCVDHLDTPEHILLAQAVYLGPVGV